MLNHVMITITSSNTITVGVCIYDVLCTMHCLYLVPTGYCSGFANVELLFTTCCTTTTTTTLITIAITLTANSPLTLTATDTITTPIHPNDKSPLKHPQLGTDS